MELKCHVLPQRRLRSAIEPGFGFHAQTCQSNFTFACRDLSRAFGSALTIKMAPKKGPRSAWHIPGLCVWLVRQRPHKVKLNLTWSSYFALYVEDFFNG